MRKLLLSAATIVAVAAVGCSSHAAGTNGAEAKIADDTTRAVYNNDMSGVTANFDGTVAPQVTRVSLGLLSDKMHSLGNYQSVTETATDLPSRTYTFDAKFDQGDMTVKLKLDADGKIAAYRVIPGAPK